MNLRLPLSTLMAATFAAGCTTQTADSVAQTDQAIVVVEDVTGTIARCDAKLDQGCRAGADAVLVTTKSRRALRARNETVVAPLALLMSPALLGAKVTLSLGGNVGDTAPKRDLVDGVATVYGRYALRDKAEGELGVLRLPSGEELRVRTSPSVQIEEGETAVRGMLTTDHDGVDLLDATYYRVDVRESSL